MFVVSLWVSLHVCFSLCLFICWRGSLLVRCLRWCVLLLVFFFSSRRRHTRCLSDWSSDVCSSDLGGEELARFEPGSDIRARTTILCEGTAGHLTGAALSHFGLASASPQVRALGDRKSVV